MPYVILFLSFMLRLKNASKRPGGNYLLFFFNMLRSALIICHGHEGFDSMLRTVKRSFFFTFKSLDPGSRAEFPVPYTH